MDDLPIRVFTNNEDMGMAFPNQQPMNIFSSIWNGDQWATQGGKVKIDWTHAPFIASYQNYNLDACVAADAYASCAMPVANEWWDQSEYQALSPAQQDKVSLQNFISNYINECCLTPSAPRDNFFGRCPFKRLPRVENIFFSGNYKYLQVFFRKL